MKSLLAKNIAWSAYGVVLTQATTFITLLILIRNLTPSDFGLVNMVVIIAGFANVIADFGFGQALIQNKEAKEIDYSTVFWVNIVLGSMILDIGLSHGLRNRLTPIHLKIRINIKVRKR
ncbi:MAG: oligosaccharide flippase family protein [Lewinellaceae bacterium]|nr:oligosaccharide flippase family protein [Lewinellaceae bacterium]